MARIRTIKPEFWGSPSVAGTSPWARLLYIAMWNWADDYGRGTANLKELEGFVFPNDDRFTDSSGNTVRFRDFVAEVSASFGVVFYTVNNRPYYQITTWEDHQRNERRAKRSKYPEPPANTGESEGVAEIPCNRPELFPTSGPGTGEQGNRGTGEQVLKPSANADALATQETRPDVESALDALDMAVVAAGYKKPSRTKGNRDAMRRLIDIDGQSLERIRAACQYLPSDEFWSPNIRSAKKLREKWHQLEGAARRRNRGGRPARSTTDDRVAGWLTLADQMPTAPSCSLGEVAA